MGINAKTIFYAIFLIACAVVPALHATRTFNTAVINGQKYTAPTTTTPKSISRNAVASQTGRYHPPPAGVNRYAQPARPMYRPPTTTPAPVKCKCDCQVGWQPVCAKDYGMNDMDTFPTKCALDCYNCTHNKHYVIISNSACP